MPDGDPESTTEPVTSTLRDGTAVLLRPLLSGDRERLRAGFEELSDEDRYRRFHRPISHLSERELDYLTQVDQHHHIAWVALDQEHPERPGVGVARAVRLRENPHIAEAALTVAPEYRGRGAGTLLLMVLARAALESDIWWFRNYVQTDNRPMLEILERLGAERELEAPGLYRADLALLDDMGQLVDSEAARAFRAAGRGEVHLASLDPPVWGTAGGDEAEPELSPNLRRWLRWRGGDGFV